MFSKVLILRFFLISIGVAVLIFGIGYYQNCRSAIILSPSFSVFNFPNYISCSVSFAGVIPSFTHQVSLSLISSAFDQKINIIKWSVIWFFINLVFELGQLITINIEMLPNMLNNYFINGTFDFIDIMALFCAVIITSSLNFFNRKTLKDK